MATRRITHRLGVSEATEAKLCAKKLDEFGPFMQKTDLELLFELNLPFAELAGVRQAVCKAVMPTSQTLKSLLDTAAEQNKLNTGIPLLDSFLQGGISPNCITEIVGAPGIGKTQLCHMLATQALRSIESGGLSDETSTVLYIDCENAFSPKRIEDIMTYTNEQNPDEAPFAPLRAYIDRITVQVARNSVEFSTLLAQLENTVVNKRVKVIFLDSIAALVRHEFDSASIIKRQNLLTTWAGTLKSLAEKTHIPIIVTNQVTSSATAEGAAIAALGTGWYHSVNTRLTLQKFKSSDFGISANSAPALIRSSAPPHCHIDPGTTLRVMGISKSPISPVVSFPYFISRPGLCLVKRLKLADTMDMDDESPYICEFEPANYWFNG